MTQHKIRGGQLLARALQEKGVQHVFTLAGGFCNPALEGFMECGIPVINCPHEQVAGHLADGHTRITRTPAVCLVGPEGFANAVPAMMEAWGERSPVIFVTGSSTMKRSGAGGFKEIDDVTAAAPLCKYSCSITCGSRIGEVVDRAWKTATDGYPGAVHISLPVDLMFSSYDPEVGREERPYLRAHRPPPRAWPVPQELAALLARIAAAKRPLLIGGHGVWWAGAEDKLAAAAAALSMPVFNMPYHHKLLPETHPAYMGLADIHQYPPAKDALQQCDLALLVGTRLDNQLNFGNPPFIPRTATLVCINGSHEELTLNRAADERLLCDPGAFFDAMMTLGDDGRTARESWFEDNRRRRGEWVECTLAELERDRAADDAIHPLHLALEVQAAMADQDWLVFDGGNTHFWCEIAVNLAGWGGRRLGGILHPGAFSMLGCGVPLALAARNTHPQARVVLVSGDGAFLSGGLSIEAAFQEQLPIVVVVDNNGSLDCIAQQQERLFAGGRHFATHFRDIPFDRMFAALGGHGERVETREQLAPALARALESGVPACVNVKTKGVISPIVLATTDKRDKASIE